MTPADLTPEGRGASFYEAVTTTYELGPDEPSRARDAVEAICEVGVTLLHRLIRQLLRLR